MPFWVDNMAQLTQEQYNILRARGLSDQKIQELAKARGFDLPTGDTGLKGFATGFAKGGIEIARETAQALQGLGQRTLAAVTPVSLEEIKKTTGIPSLDETKPEGRGVSEILETKSTAEQAGKVAANVAAFFIPTSKATQIAGRVIKGTGEAVSKLGIGISAKEAPLVQAYKARTPLFQRIKAVVEGVKPAGKPVIARETALRQGIFGTESMIGIKARRGADNLWQQVVAPALEKSGVKIQMKEFIDDIAKQVDRVDDLSRRKELQSALEAFADDFKSVGEIPLSKLQRFKEGWTKFLPDKVYKGKPIAGSFREIQNIAAQLARNKIYNSVSLEVKAAYFDYGNLKNLQALGQRALTRAKLKGGAGSFVSGVLDMGLTPIATTGGLTLYKVGKGLEFVGTAGLKTVRQIFGF